MNTTKYTTWGGGVEAGIKSNLLVPYLYPRFECGKKYSCSAQVEQGFH